MEDSLRRCVAEAIGTFCLVFAGTAAIVVDAAGGGVTHVGVSMVFGLVVLTAILMYLILAVSSGSREKGITAGLAIGGMVTLEALLGGPVSGASMNPVRSLAPALVSGRLDHLWIYLTAPLVGAAVAVVACRYSRPAGCCDGRCLPEYAV